MPKTINPASELSQSMPRWFSAGRAASIAFWERLRGDAIPQSIFHYTSTAALVSIVRNNEIWLSDASFLNDSSEIGHGRNLACLRLEGAIGLETCIESKLMLQATMEMFKSRPDPDIYVACFSLEGDDLAQWRGYGQGDAPIAIEFEVGPMMFGYVSEGILGRAIYDYNDKEWGFDQVLTKYIEAYREDIRTPIPMNRREPLSREEERSICAGKLYHDLWRYIVICKEQAFASEREVRFIYMAHDFSKTWEGWYPEHPDAMYRERNGRIVPYLSSKNLSFKNMERVGDIPKLPIRSVRIGPMADQKIIAKGVRRLLDAFEHLEAEVTYSGVPFRSG